MGAPRGRHCVQREFAGLEALSEWRVIRPKRFKVLPKEHVMRS